MKKQTKRSFLAFLLAVCMILSPLGTTAVRAAAPAEEGKTEKEQITEEAAAEEMGTTESAQGESAADENASAAVTVVNTEETEAAPAAFRYCFPDFYVYIIPTDRAAHKLQFSRIVKRCPAGRAAGAFWRIRFLIGGVFTLIMYLVFGLLLGIVLPRSPLGFV